MASENNSVNDETYTKLYAAWVRTHSIRASALEAGVAPSTAGKYINRPVLSDGRPGIRAALKQRHSEAINKIDRDIQSLANINREVLVTKFAEITNLLKKVEIRVSGETLASGNIAVSEHTYRRLLSMAGSLSDALNDVLREKKRIIVTELAPEESEAPDSDATLNPSPKDVQEPGMVRSRAVDILTRFESAVFNDPNTRAETERNLISTLTTATLRAGRGAPQQEELDRAAGSESEEEEPLIAASN